MCCQHNQGLRRRLHRTELKGDTPSPGIDIKIPDPTGNRNLAAELDARDSADRAAEMKQTFYVVRIIEIIYTYLK